MAALPVQFFELELGMPASLLALLHLFCCILQHILGATSVEGRASHCQRVRHTCAADAKPLLSCLELLLLLVLQLLVSSHRLCVPGPDPHVVVASPFAERQRGPQCRGFGSQGLLNGVEARGTLVGVRLRCGQSLFLGPCLNYLALQDAGCSLHRIPFTLNLSDLRANPPGPQVALGVCASPVPERGDLRLLRAEPLRELQLVQLGVRLEGPKPLLRLVSPLVCL
mmetsp:Transcript_47386/g.152127  ORF Transcript_47386/g.152127 Transcript_47386/m.152127 type:complete len:225 (+) Transcript_47386:795-1469(+)